ncbi:hypothetical protein [Allorhodopirellula heiligendammensis]|uniref:Uncharacterized protein n=1 Tax=Allorhodopirellula heiligendammensis TaxID=2714739 RepID=A0A5C6C3T4_9BACT|nr:hypothetical protein [Allorhodopirellula heiligendammensis]TWU19240.1 hypothetical protein Poly21_14120 [Allorhodopirellula heiligendammensis]
MASAPKQIDLTGLRRVHELAAARFPHDYLDVGLGAIGLFLNDPPKNAGYRCTPTNSLTIAGLGVDGIHVGCVTDSHVVDPMAPIVLTIPMAFESPNFIVGETLHDFLCLGCRNGYANLANLHLLFDDTMAYYQGIDDDDFDDRAPKILDMLATELSLEPWADVRQHFDELQSRFMPVLRMPAIP